MEQNHNVKLAASLERTSLYLEVLTVVLVITVSPLSFIIGLAMGIQPETWLSLWGNYVFFFIILAILVAIAGFGAATSYRVKAQALRRSLRGP